MIGKILRDEVTGWACLITIILGLFILAGVQVGKADEKAMHKAQVAACKEQGGRVTINEDWTLGCE